MVEKIAFTLTQQYINGWKRNDLSMILSCLTENCMVIESHGPTYHGIADIERWFKFWLEAKSKVTKWDIASFFLCLGRSVLGPTRRILRTFQKINPLHLAWTSHLFSSGMRPPQDVPGGGGIYFEDAGLHLHVSPLF